MASPSQSDHRTAGGASPPLTSKTTYRPERFATILGTRLKDKTLEVADLFPQVQESSAAAVWPFVTLNHWPASFSTVFAAPATLLWALARCALRVGEFVHGRCVVADRIASGSLRGVWGIHVLQRPTGARNAGRCDGASRGAATSSCPLPFVSRRLRHGES